MKDAKRIHTGCEYLVNERFTFRMGYLYNPRCFPKDQIAPLTPANTFHTVHLGIGYKIKDNIDIDITIDKGFSKTTKVSESETGYPGTYDNDATSINLGFSFHY